MSSTVIHLWAANHYQTFVAETCITHVQHTILPLTRIERKGSAYAYTDTVFYTAYYRSIDIFKKQFLLF